MPTPPSSRNSPTKPAQLAARHGITCRVGDNRQSARCRDPAKCILQTGPLPRYVSRLAVHQKVFEDLGDGTRMAIGNQIVSKMGSAHDVSPGQGTGSCVSPGDTGPVQAPADLRGPPVTKCPEPGQPRLQDLALRIDIQAEYVDSERLPADRDLDPGDQTETGDSGLLAGLLESVGGIVVCQGEHIHTGIVGRLHQAGRGQGTVGRQGMAVEIMVDRHGVILQDMPQICRV